MLRTTETDVATVVPRREAEEHLVAAAKTGDQEAFEALIAMHRGRIGRVRFLITRNREDSEDVTQVVFIKAFRRIESFERRSSFLTWLTRIAVNESLMQIRRRGRATVALGDAGAGEQNDNASDVSDARPTPEQSCSFKEMQAFLASTAQATANEDLKISSPQS